MARIAACLSILAVAALSACAHYPAETPTIVKQEAPYRAGSGVVVARTQAPAPMAAAGASASASPAPYRLTIKMDNGAVQYIDTDNGEINAGARVELTPDRMIRKL